MEVAKVHTYERILVYLDGFKLAEQILPRTEVLGFRFKSQLILLRVVDLSAAVWDYPGQTIGE
jgi:hypothetical protein